MKKLLTLFIAYSICSCAIAQYIGYTVGNTIDSLKASGVSPEFFYHKVDGEEINAVVANYGGGYLNTFRFSNDQEDIMENSIIMAMAYVPISLVENYIKIINESHLTQVGELKWYNYEYKLPNGVQATVVYYGTFRDDNKYFTISIYLADDIEDEKNDPGDIIP